MAKSELEMTKFLAEITLFQAGEILWCKVANYARDESTAITMFLSDLGISGKTHGRIGLTDEHGNVTYWVFERMTKKGNLEISRTKEAWTPLRLWVQ